MPIPTPAHSGFSKWLTARLAEPDSRIALSGLVPLLLAVGAQKISLTVFGISLLVLVIMFILPGPLAEPIVQAIEKETGLTPVMVPAAWTTPMPGAAVVAHAPQEPQQPHGVAS